MVESVPPLLLGVGALGDRLPEVCCVAGLVWSLPGPSMLLAWGGEGLGLVVGTLVFTQNKQQHLIKFVSRRGM